MEWVNLTSNRLSKQEEVYLRELGQASRIPDVFVSRIFGLPQYLLLEVFYVDRRKRNTLWPVMDVDVGFAEGNVHRLPREAPPSGQIGNGQHL